MAVPKRKTSKSKKRHRKGHDKLKARQTVSCTQCNKQHLPHHVCMSCGYYRGRKVVDIEI